MRILFSTIAVAASFSGFAQHNLGVATSNFAGINSLALNPANISECRELKSVNILSLSYGVDNNVGPFNAKEGFVVALDGGKTNNMFQYTNNSRISMLAPYINIAGPAVMFRLDKTNTIAITTGLRGMNQFNNFDQTLFHTFNEPGYIAEKNVLATLRDFSYTVHLWTEIGASYAGVFYNDGHNKIKAGGTLRYLSGIAYVGVTGSTMDAKFTQGTNSFSAGNAELEYSSNALNTRASQGNDISKGFVSLLGKRKFGTGFGGDLGVVYEHKPMDAKPTDGYKTKFSVAVCDIGAVTYNDDINTTEKFTGTGELTGSKILANVKNFENMKTYAVKSGFKAEITKEAKKVHMPTRLMLAGDYHLQKEYFINVTFLINLANREKYGNSYYSQFSITPRYEYKKLKLSLGLPISYSTLSNRFKTGIGAMYKSIFVGSDDLLAIVSRSQYGLNFYGGASVRMYK
jgi:hypothetical protein